MCAQKNKAVQKKHKDQKQEDANYFGIIEEHNTLKEEKIEELETTKHK